MDFKVVHRKTDQWLSGTKNKFKLSLVNGKGDCLHFSIPDTNITFDATFLEDQSWIFHSSNEAVQSELNKITKSMEFQKQKMPDEALQFLCAGLDKFVVGLSDPGNTCTNLEHALSKMSSTPLTQHHVDVDMNDFKEDEVCSDEEEEDDGMNYYCDDPDVEDLLDTKEEKEDVDIGTFFATQGSQMAVQRLTKDLKNLLKQGKTFGFSGSPQENNLFKWDVQITDVPEDTRLGRDLKTYAEKYKREPVICLEMQFPGDYPFSPPFIRVLRPRFRFLTGHVTVGGSICMEMLTKSGWRPTNDIESILVQVRCEILSDPNASLDPGSPDKAYSELEARDAFDRMVVRYGWNK